MIRNENNRNSKTINSIIDEVYKRRGVNSRNNANAKDGEATRTDDRLHNRKQGQIRQRNDNDKDSKFDKELNNENTTK